MATAPVPAKLWVHELRQYSSDVVLNGAEFPDVAPLDLLEIHSAERPNE